MKNFFTLLFVFCLHSAWAANYYFSTVSGDDSRTTVQAQSPSTPWKSLGKLNTYFSSFQPGDSILLQRGEIFYGSITVSKSGTASLPIFIGAFGTGNKPVITSLVTLNNWVSKGAGIWESHNPFLATTVNTVLLNDEAQQIGRYPNSDASNKGYLTFESHVGDTSITDNELTSTINWTGAEVVIRTRRWVTDRNLITSHSGNTIYYKASSQYSPYDNYGYFIQNDIKTLDKFGEWYYNASTKKLSVYFGSNTPSSYAVQATTIDNLIKSQKYSNVVFDNLSIEGANASGIYVKYGSNIHVRNCNIIFSGGNGVSAYFHTNFKLENCTVSNSNNGGIDLGYAGNYATIRNNKILNTSAKAGIGGSGDGKGIALQSHGNGSIIEYNEIRNTGYIGIKFGGDYVTVKNNFIDSFCTTKDDGSAIYTFTGSSNATRVGRKVIGNIVMDGIGASAGTNDRNILAEGIYMDDNSAGVEITGNTVANIRGKGIFLHNARGITITNNTVFNNKVQLSVVHDTKGDAVRNCVITNNNFFSKLPSQNAAIFNSIANDNNLIGRLDSNYYTRPIDDRLLISNSYVNNLGVRIGQNLELKGWKEKYNYDAASKKSAKQIAAYKLNSLISATKVGNGRFTSNIDGVFKSLCTTSWSNNGQLDSGCLQVVPTSRGSSVYMRIGGVIAGKKYIVRYSVRGSVDSSTTITTYLRQGFSPYANITAVQRRKVNSERSDKEMLFSPSTTESAATIVLNVDDQSQYYLDNIQVYEADAVITNIEDSLRLVFNPTAVSKTVSLNGSYVDVKNNKYANSILLKPFASAVLIKDGGVENIAPNSAPTVYITSPVVNEAVAAPASVTISATATDSGGTISKVEFYNNDTLLGTATASPYSFTWKNVPTGTYSIKAKATDNGSITTTSASVAISVYSTNAAPSVSLTSPVATAKYVGPATINMTAAAADKDGTISNVKFYNGTKYLKTIFKSPYTYSITNVAAGTYTITAKATDNNGAVTMSAPVTVTVLQNVAPSVRITNPLLNLTYNSPATINISAAAKDTDGSIYKVDFYNDTTLLITKTTAPYTYSWSNVATGNYIIIAKATDNKGTVTRSAPVTISVVEKPLSLRGALNHDTIVAVNNNVNLINTDTTKIVNNPHAVTLKRDFVSMAKRKTYNVNVFPNPAINKIQISVDGLPMNSQKANLSIQNLSGIIIKSIPVVLSGKTFEANVTSLPSGLYTLSIVSDNLSISKKFIKI